MNVNQGKRALILTYKTVFNTPRVLKEINWLTEEGWTVDTLGLGEILASNGRHFPIGLPGALTRYFSYLFLSNERRFSHLVGSRIPQNLSGSLSDYDLLIVHDLTLLPWVNLRNVIASTDGPSIWIDLHENHVDSLSRNFLEKVAFESYRKWELSFLEEIARTRATRIVFSSVSPWISERFQELLGQKVITLRNAPKLQDLPPSPTSQERISLVHHGVGTTHRGIEQAIRALKQLPERFTLHLMLVASWGYMAKLRMIAAANGVSNRVEFMKPVPTVDISKTINQFDVALVVNPPITVSELRALPNKFFESIQASLALVVGPNPEMGEFVNKHGNGFVLKDWSTESLLDVLNGVAADEIRNAKFASFLIREEASVLREQVLFTKVLNELSP